MAVFALPVVIVGWRQVLSIARVIATTILGALLAAFLLYTAGEIAVLVRVDFWRPELAFEALLWIASVGFSLAYYSATGDKRRARKAAVGAITATSLLGVAVNLKTFSLPVELALLPIAAMLTLMAMYVTESERPDFHQAKRFADRGMVLFGCVFFFYALLGIATDWNGFDKGEAVRAILLPPVLTVGVFPFLAGASAYFRAR